MKCPHAVSQTTVRDLDDVYYYRKDLNQDALLNCVVVFGVVGRSCICTPHFADM